MPELIAVAFSFGAIVVCMIVSIFQARKQSDRERNLKRLDLYEVFVEEMPDGKEKEEWRAHIASERERYNA